MLIFANWGYCEKCSMVVIRHPSVSSNWRVIQSISVIKTGRVQAVYCVFTVCYIIQNFDWNWPPY